VPFCSGQPISSPLPKAFRLPVRFPNGEGSRPLHPLLLYFEIKEKSKILRGFPLRLLGSGSFDPRGFPFFFSTVHRGPPRRRFFSSAFFSFPTLSFPETWATLGLFSQHLTRPFENSAFPFSPRTVRSTASPPLPPLFPFFLLFHQQKKITACTPCVFWQKK